MYEWQCDPNDCAFFVHVKLLLSSLSEITSLLIHTRENQVSFFYCLWMGREHRKEGGHEEGEKKGGDWKGGDRIGRQNRVRERERERERE